jgi:hypothetical protein
VATAASTYTDADLAYFREHFATLQEICAGRAETPDDVRRLIAERKLPRPSYVLDDGTELVPRDYFALADAAGGVERVRDEYERRYREAIAANALELDADLLERRWDDYLDGISGICMRDVTPATIVRKRVLIDEIERLVAEPAPHDATWRERLHEAVDELDAIEKPFAPDFDRNGRFVPTRDTYIRDVRERFADVWPRDSR